MNFRYEPESKPLDGYTIKRAIQRGGFGEVYYALSDGGKEVALKLLQSNADVELRGIAQCLNLKHSNLLSIFDVKESAAGEQFVIMEYVAGRTLGEVIAEKPNGMDHQKVEEILTQIAAGAEYLHERGIVRRRINRRNSNEATVRRAGPQFASSCNSSDSRTGSRQGSGEANSLGHAACSGVFGSLAWHYFGSTTTTDS